MERKSMTAEAEGSPSSTAEEGGGEGFTLPAVVLTDEGEEEAEVDMRMR